MAEKYRRELQSAFQSEIHRLETDLMNDDDVFDRFLARRAMTKFLNKPGLFEKAESLGMASALRSTIKYVPGLEANVAKSPKGRELLSQLDAAAAKEQAAAHEGFVFDKAVQVLRSATQLLIEQGTDPDPFERDKAKAEASQAAKREAGIQSLTDSLRIEGVEPLVLESRAMAYVLTSAAHRVPGLREAVEASGDGMVLKKLEFARLSTLAKREVELKEFGSPRVKAALNLLKAQAQIGDPLKATARAETIALSGVLGRGAFRTAVATMLNESGVRLDDPTAQRYARLATEIAADISDQHKPTDAERAKWSLLEDIRPKQTRRDGYQAAFEATRATRLPYKPARNPDERDIAAEQRLNTILAEALAVVTVERMAIEEPTLIEAYEADNKMWSEPLLQSNLYRERDDGWAQRDNGWAHMAAAGGTTSTLTSGSLAG